MGKQKVKQYARSMMQTVKKAAREQGECEAALVAIPKIEW